LAAGLKYRPDVRSESRPFCHCLERGERRKENERTDEKETRNKAMPKHQLNIAPITKTRNADSAAQHFIRVQVDDESLGVVPKTQSAFQTDKTTARRLRHAVGRDKYPPDSAGSRSIRSSQRTHSTPNYRCPTNTNSPTGIRKRRNSLRICNERAM